MIGKENAFGNSGVYRVHRPGRSFSPLWLATVISLLATPGLAAADAAPLANKAYTIRLLGDGSASVTVAGCQAQTFRPTFTVLYRRDDPKVRSRTVDLRYPVPDWALQGSARTANYFQAAEAVTLSAADAKLADGRIRWAFPPRPGFSLEATLDLPAGDGPPRIGVVLRAIQPGWYSVGYTGAPERRPEEVASLFQPLIWQERRFPADCYLSDESNCSLPAALMETDGVTVSVIADPLEVPFRLPTRDNARFGAMIRNAGHKAQPMLFAPVLGKQGSKLDADQRFAFNLRISVRPGGCYESYRWLAKELYGVRDRRENTFCSLNQTLQNMIAFAMDDQVSGWMAEYRACDYTTDAAKTVKLVSALHPLSIALATDDEDIFLRRARPMIEFLLSREKYLFLIDEHVAKKKQNPSRRMDGPTGETFEWSSLLKMSQDRTPTFLDCARIRFETPRALNLDSVPHDDRWVQCLAMYRATGDRKYLEQARHEADDYLRQRVARPAIDFADCVKSAQFWTDLVPRWMQLLELYEETGEKRYLDAAAAGAKLHAMLCWMSPPVPERDVTIPISDAKTRPTCDATASTWTRKTSVPAWRVSQIGLTPEATTTSAGARAVFLAHHAPFMLRMAQLTGDDFFRTIGRWAVIGRYPNFPGYTYRPQIGFTVEQERPDYPTCGGPLYYRASPMYFNHVWSHIALILDYLVSDAFACSDGQIDFPSRYAQGYVYLQCKVYGDRPGRFYGDRGVQLYLPAKLLETDNVQMNYVAGHGNGNLYVALLNQTDRRGNVTVRFNPKLSGLNSSRSYRARVWRENRPASPTVIEKAAVTVAVEPRGITALAIEGADVRPAFQEKVFDKGAASLGPSSHKSVDSPLGRIHGKLLSFGRELTNAYVWLAADDKQVTEARLHYRTSGGAWQEVADRVYPFEFSVPLPDKDGAWEFWVEGRPRRDPWVRSQTVSLHR